MRVIVLLMIAATLPPFLPAPAALIVHVLALSLALALASKKPLCRRSGKRPGMRHRPLRNPDADIRRSRLSTRYS